MTTIHLILHICIMDLQWLKYTPTHNMRYTMPHFNKMPHFKGNLKKNS